MNEDKFQENKNFLKRYLPYVTQIKELECRLYSLDLKIESTQSVQISGLPGGGIPRTLNDDLEKHEELENRINKLLKESKSIRDEILYAIDHVGNAKQSRILELRYIEGLDVTDISDEVHNSIRQVIRHCNRGISNVTLVSNK